MRLKFHIRRYFVTGLLVTLPLAGTYMVLKAILGVLEGVLGEYLERYLPGQYYPGFGIAVLIISIFVIGLLTANMIGRWTVEWFELLLERTPVVRGIYSAIKSVVQTISVQGKNNFKGVVLVPFPKEGCHALGFVVNRTTGPIANRFDVPFLNIFVPTSPNPTSGFTLFLPERDVVYLEMSSDEAMKVIMSGGLYSGDGSGDAAPGPGQAAG